MVRGNPIKLLVKESNEHKQKHRDFLFEINFFSALILTIFLPYVGSQSNMKNFFFLEINRYSALILT